MTKIIPTWQGKYNNYNNNYLTTSQIFIKCKLLKDKKIKIMLFLPVQTRKQE